MIKTADGERTEREVKDRKRERERERISIHTNQAEKNILTTGDHIK